ncbi:hypothetical protein A6R68_13189 [Neotoma lepida]|uniref:Uncharacterized protein n=1 Tax=Neotoma lepida TaxID=56216 RepID=A0A1A6H0W4_NEOLE|nr:hypothetical protein A6R68_13189 [Neotoma lepida]
MTSSTQTPFFSEYKRGGQEARRPGGSSLLSDFILSELIRLLMQLLSADLLDCPRKGVGAPAADGWNRDKKV